MKLRAGRGAKHDRLQAAVEHIVDRAYERWPVAHVHRQPAEVVRGEQAHALVTRQLEHCGGHFRTIISRGAHGPSRNGGYSSVTRIQAYPRTRLCQRITPST